MNLPNDQNWERKTIENLLFSAYKEQRRKRIWDMIFRGFLAFYLVLLLLLFLPGNGSSKKLLGPHVALIDVHGVIEAEENANSDEIVSELKTAFESEEAKGVILKINSPGGSAVEASTIYDEILRLKTLNPEKKVVAVITELGASAAYFIASAADEIYANPASLVGSIGVLMDGFGYTTVMDKVGVERRLVTAGTHKAFLDPFSPVTSQDKQYAQKMVDGVHGYFIDAVKKGRGSRLKIDNDTFSGMVWIGKDALKVGLIDGFGSSETVARELFHVEEIVQYTPEKDFMERLTDKFKLFWDGNFKSQVRLSLLFPTTHIR